MGVSRFLVEHGARVTVTDLRGEEELAESLRQLEGLALEYHLGGHRQSDFVESDLVVVNPAVRRDSPWLRMAREHDVGLTSEMNLFFSLCAAQIIGVTGSNGKSTTTAMIGEVLRRKRKTWVGGNIGWGSLLEKLEQIRPSDLVVLELSSFQLFDLGFLQCSPQVAVVTNIAANHLDWHGTMEEYVKAKQNILRYQKEGDIAILNRFDGQLIEWEGLTPGKVVWYPQEDIKEIELTVPGEHNRMNAAAALVVAEVFEVDREEAKGALKGFKGLPHRLEFIRELEGVRYYNDSIATTPESALAAIDSFAGKKVVILGGYDKKLSLEKLVEKVVGKVEVVMVLGEVRDRLAEMIEKEKQRQNDNFPKCIKAEDFNEAIKTTRKQAQEIALKGDPAIVLLSPGCASYDMFDNFQQLLKRQLLVVTS